MADVKRRYERSGPDVNPGRHTEHERNKSIMASLVFVKACGLAEIKPTLRQASKFKNSKGLAFSKRAEAVRIIKSTEENN